MLEPQTFEVQGADDRLFGVNDARDVLLLNVLFPVIACVKMSAAPTWGHVSELCRCPLSHAWLRKTVLIPGEAGSVPRCDEMSKSMYVTVDEVIAAICAVMTG